MSPRQRAYDGRRKSIYRLALRPSIMMIDAKALIMAA
jgi:hypothetical protein